MSMAFNNSFSPRKRAISSSNRFLSSAVVCVVSLHPLAVLHWIMWRTKVDVWKRWGREYRELVYSLSKYQTNKITMNKQTQTHPSALVWSFCTYSKALDRMPPFDWPSMAAMLTRPLLPISWDFPSAGMMLPNFIIQ